MTDRLGITYSVTRTPLGANALIYNAFAGDVSVARAVLRVDKGCISDVLVHRKADRRRGIATALYALIEADLGRPLRPSRIRFCSKVGRAFWASKKAGLMVAAYLFAPLPLLSQEAPRSVDREPSQSKGLLTVTRATIGQAVFRKASLGIAWPPPLKQSKAPVPQRSMSFVARLRQVKAG